MRIAILDDSHILRTALRNTLSSGGFDVVFDAGASAELFKYLRENSVDLVLLDVFFPDENGLDILSALKNLNKNIKVIVITGMNQQSITKEAQRLNADDILYKPFGAKELFTALEKQKSKM